MKLDFVMVIIFYPADDKNMSSNFKQLLNMSFVFKGFYIHIKIENYSFNAPLFL